MLPLFDQNLARFDVKWKTEVQFVAAKMDRKQLSFSSVTI